MKSRILAAIDGSDQAMDAVRYISRIFPAQNTEVVLLHISTEYPESFLDLSMTYASNSSSTSINSWKNQMKKNIEKFMADAKLILTGAGFPSESVIIKIHEKKIGVARDILEESRTGYSLVVAGRTGVSRIKDVIIGSIAFKLIGRVPHIPVVTVVGNPDSKKILIGFDGSNGAKKAVDYVAKLLGVTDCEVTLTHVIRPMGNLYGQMGLFTPAEEAEYIAINSKMIEPAFIRGEYCLKKGGFSSGHISREILTMETSRAAAITHKAEEEGYGTIVVGRRGISKVEEFIMGRVSTKVLNMVTKAAVWIV